MSWPIGSDYQDIIQNPATAFTDADLRLGTVVTNRLGLPRVASGNFASVYEMHCGSRRWAVRCLLRKVADQQRRYELLSRHLSGLWLPPLVGFVYLPQGIRVRGEWYPLVKMEWVEGVALHTFVERHLHDPQALYNLAARWRGLVNSLRGSRLAHGDLQHGNVLVTSSGDLKLVDYDAMFVPALHGEQSSELGHANYQHPLRSASDYDDRLDTFAALVIYLSLQATATTPTLWPAYHSGDNLLFRQSDFINPARSPLFAELRQHSHLSVVALAAILERACHDPLSGIPDLEQAIHFTEGITLPTSAPVAPVPVSPVAAPRPPAAPPALSTPAPPALTAGRWWERATPIPSSSPFVTPTSPQTVTATTTLPGSKVNPKDGAEMILIPAGTFTMGDSDQSDNPPHQVYLDAYYIYKNLVTVGQYKRFCAATSHKMPIAPSGFNPNWSKDDHPIVKVSWYDAQAYCKWAGTRLPSEAEWEKAARGTDGRKFPWGDQFDMTKLWCSKSKGGDAGGTTSIGKYGVSPYGLTDMAGNVWQWCEDVYCVLRGGSWSNGNADYFRCAYRGNDLPNSKWGNFGFRCAVRAASP